MSLILLLKTFSDLGGTDRLSEIALVFLRQKAAEHFEINKKPANIGGNPRSQLQVRRHFSGVQRYLERSSLHGWNDAAKQEEWQTELARRGACFPCSCAPAHLASKMVSTLF